jgi:hypothetical protein
MLSGFNTNFRYRGVLFHVQTEDSGRGHPHVITHLFHGGNIIASEKRDYAHLLSGADVEMGVRKLMEGQHKAMLKRLSRGEHDQLIADRLGPGIFGSGTDGSGHTDPLQPAGPRVEDSIDRSVEQAVAEAVDEASRAGSTTQPAREARPGGARSERGTPDPGLSRVFGDRVVSEKPLDEVVLDYLVENARKRKRSGR